MTAVVRIESQPDGAVTITIPGDARLAKLREHVAIATALLARDRGLAAVEVVSADGERMVLP